MGKSGIAARFERLDREHVKALKAEMERQGVSNPQHLAVVNAGAYDEEHDVLKQLEHDNAELPYSEKLPLLELVKISHARVVERNANRPVDRMDADDVDPDAAAEIRGTFGGPDSSKRIHAGGGRGNVTKISKNRKTGEFEQVQQLGAKPAGGASSGRRRDAKPMAKKLFGGRTWRCAKCRKRQTADVAVCMTERCGAQRPKSGRKPDFSALICQELKDFLDRSPEIRPSDLIDVLLLEHRELPGWRVPLLERFAGRGKPDKKDFAHGAHPKFEGERGTRKSVYLAPSVIEQLKAMGAWRGRSRSGQRFDFSNALYCAFEDTGWWANIMFPGIGWTSGLSQDQIKAMKRLICDHRLRNDIEEWELTAIAREHYTSVVPPS